MLIKKIWNRCINSTLYSIQGIKYAIQNEEAFRFEIVILILAIIVGIYLGESPFERVFLIGSIMLILIVELLNSAIEATIDRISTEKHPLSKAAKDTGSAAVFCSFILASYIWCEILFNHFLESKI